jgi:hypothetical protein
MSAPIEILKTLEFVGIRVKLRLGDLDEPLEDAEAMIAIGRDRYFDEDGNEVEADDPNAVLVYVGGTRRLDLWDPVRRMRLSDAP